MSEIEFAYKCYLNIIQGIPTQYLHLIGHSVKWMILNARWHVNIIIFHLVLYSKVFLIWTIVRGSAFEYHEIYWFNGMIWYNSHGSQTIPIKKRFSLVDSRNSRINNSCERKCTRKWSPVEYFRGWSVRYLHSVFVIYLSL